MHSDDSALNFYIGIKKKKNQLVTDMSCNKIKDTTKKQSWAPTL